MFAMRKLGLKGGRAFTPSVCANNTAPLLIKIQALQQNVHRKEVQKINKQMKNGSGLFIIKAI